MNALYCSKENTYKRSLCNKPRQGLIVISVLLFLLILSFTPDGYARSTVVTVDAEGYGSRKGDAVADALLQAVSQVNGSEIAGQTMSSLKETAIENDNGNSYLLSESYQNDIAARSQGVVKSWELLSANQDSDGNGMWVVNVRAEISKYQSSKQLKRLRMAVVDFRLENNVSKKLGTSVSNAFTRSLEDGLTQSRKFAMLDRSFEKEQHAELSKIANGGFAIEEMARLGNKAGTDYLIVGTVSKANSLSKKIKLKTSEEEITVSTSTVAISYRIIDATTSQVKFSAETADTQQGVSLTALSKKLANKSVSKILNAIFPIRVLDVDDKTLALSQGGNSLKIGQKYKLVKLGAPLIDPYTKESLGRKETVIGEVKVIDVQAKSSTAEIIKLTSNIDKKTLILRPMENVSTNPGSASVESVTKQAKKKIKELEKESSDEW